MNPTEIRPEADAGDKEQAARQALRSAIERRDLAAGELAQAEQASQAAFSRAVEIGDQIETIAERRKWRPDMARGDDGDVLIEALLNERDLPAAQVPADEALRSLQAEHAALRQARERLAPVILARKGRLEFVEAKVEELARGVIAASSAPERLLAGLLEMQASVLRRRVGLAFVRGCLSRGAATTARAPVFDDRLEDSAVFRQSPVAISERAKWAAALKALETDPEAKLPGDERITE